MLIKRILMNAADASGGNGAPPPPTAPVDAPPQAQGAPAANPLEDVVAKLAAQVEGIAKSMNSLHAEGRRAREGKAPAKQETKDDATSTADDPGSLLALRDAFDDSTSELKLTKGQRQLLREAVMAKRLHPSDVDGFVTDYVSRAGWGSGTSNPAPASAPAPAPPPAPQNAHPASDRGSPPPPKAPLHEADLLTMNDTDRAALIKEKGMKWFSDKLRSQTKGRPVSWR
jgi:hypothetical protein